MKSLFLLIISTLLLNGESNQAPIVFTHVTVIDTAGPSIQPDMTVTIVGDHIAELGRAVAIRVPESAQVVDGRGKFLIPGLWDMHVHTFTHDPRSTSTWFFPLFIANGVTGVRDMWTTGDDVPQVGQFRQGLADGSFLGPRYGAVGWLVDGQDPFWAFADVVRTPQEARDFVRKAKASGVDFVKVYWKLTPEEYFAIADESKKVGLPFAGHVPFVVSATAASDAGQRSIEHLTNVDIGCSTKEQELLPIPEKTWGPKQQKETLDTYDQRKCEQLMDRFAHNQTWQVPTLMVSERASGSDPRLKYVPVKVRVIREQSSHDDLMPQQQQLRERQRRQALTIIAMMNKAGVPIMAGTDVSSVRLYPGFSLHDELALFVQAGLTPGEALKTATYNPAKFLGELDRLGTIEKGKLADLVLLDANPLDDIANTQKIRALVLNGRYLDRRALDKLLAGAVSVASTQ